LTFKTTLSIERTRIIPIAGLPAFEMKGLPPVLLNLPRNRRGKRPSFKPIFQTLSLNVAGVVHAGQIRRRPTAVYRVTVGTSPAFEEYSGVYSKEMAEHKPVAPQASATALGAGSGPFPGELYSQALNFPQIQPTKK